MTQDRGLSVSARAVLAQLLASREATRRQLCERASLSKPTVSLALAELDAAQLIRFIRRSQGPVGRSADVYGLSLSAGWVLGLDVGSTHITGRAYALDGTILDGVRPEIDKPGLLPWREALQQSAAAIHAFVRRVSADHGALRAAGIAVPTIVPIDPSGGAMSGSVDATMNSKSVGAAIGLAQDIPVLLENNVNCSAIAELRVGAGRGRDDLVYLQVGVKVGLGIVLSGRLVRGANAAAGEVALLPFPLRPGSRTRRGALEEYLGSAGLLRRAESAWGDATPPKNAAELFTAAVAGNAVAKRLISRHARDVGNLVGVLTSIVDPGLIVLGGGVGANPILLPEVRKTTQSLVGGTEIRITELGDLATVTGAALLAMEQALDLLLEDEAASRNVVSAIGMHVWPSGEPHPWQDVTTR